jgi:hypothetical protein
VGFGIDAIRPRVAAVDASTPTITRADVKQNVASVNLGTMVDFQCGPVSLIQGALPTTAPRLIDVPPLICMAAVRGTFRVHQPGEPIVSASMLYAIFDAQTGNLVAKNDRLIPPFARVFPWFV